METQFQNVFEGETKMVQPLKNDKLHFETVFILDNGFEELHPESFSSEFHDTDGWDSPRDGRIEPNFNEVNDEVEFPSYSCLTNEFTEESKVIFKLGPHGSAAMLDEVDRKDGCFSTDCKPFIVSESHSQSNLTNSDTTENSPLLISSFLDKVPKIAHSFSCSQINKDVISKKEIKSLKLKQKEKHLSSSLNKIHEIIKNERMKKSALNAKNKRNIAIKKTSHSKNIKGNEKECQQSELAPNSGQNLKKIPNVILNDPPKDCNIDFLKNCIIEASRTLIETNNSLRTLNKLLHSEIFIEKEEAVKHLKDFQFAFKSFKKRMNGIDNRLLTHYRNVMPSTETKPLCENQKSSLDSPMSNKRINDSEGLSNGGKVYEVIKPMPKKEIKRIKSTVKDKQKVICNLKNSLLNDTSIEIESKKRRKPSNCSTSPKKIRTRILHQNWFSEKNNRSKPKPNEKHTSSGYSLPPSVISGEPIIVLD